MAEEVFEKSKFTETGAVDEWSTTYRTKRLVTLKGGGKVVAAIPPSYNSAMAKGWPYCVSSIRCTVNPFLSRVQCTFYSLYESQKGTS